MKINDILVEFAPSGGGGSGNYFQALASAWYNGTFDTGSLQKGIKSQQDVERLLNRGIVCPDGKTRKLHIDYNADFDGVEIYSDDYYEYGDHDDTIDSRTGQKWGPYDFMAFSDEDLSEGLNEFAADGDSGRWYTDDQMTDLVGDGWWQDMDISGANIGVPDSEVPKAYMIQQAQRWLKRQGHNVQVLNVRVNDDDVEWYIEGAFPKDLTEFAADDGDSGEDDVLRKYAQMWWNGDDATQQQIERALAKMGWEIGEDEGGYDNGGVFVVRAGDEHGRSYTSWAAEDLVEGVAEGWREESQDLEDWAKEVNKKLYKAHASQRPALAQQLSQLEHKHFGSPANPLTRIVKSALTALRNGQMPHYDSDKVGAMPFGSLVGDDAKEIAAANLHASENQGYSILKRNRIVDTVDDFLRLVDVVQTLPPEYLFKYKDAGGQAWFEIVKDIGWSKDDAPGQRYRVSQGVAEGDLNEKSTSQAQFRTMAAAAHDPKFAKKVGIKPSVAREFNRADKGQDYKSLPKKATEGAPVTTTPGSVEPGGAVDNFKQQMANNTEKQAGVAEAIPLKTLRSQGRDEKEADYGDDYQQMVLRLKKLAGAGPLKTQYDPNKRVYRNMPTAVQPKK